MAGGSESSEVANVARAMPDGDAASLDSPRLNQAADAPLRAQPVSARASLALAVATMAVLAPLMHKPMHIEHIDDPLFVWLARQVSQRPLDPYGFEVVWGYVRTPMIEATKNPPLASYWLACGAAIGGWSEAALHLTMMAPAVASIVGVYFLAALLRAPPLASALLTLATPVWLVSASTLMCDTLLLACWLWAIWAWLRGLETQRVGWLLLAAALIAAAALSKYFGLALVPLLAAVAWRRLGWRASWAFPLILAIGLVASYEAAMAGLYNRGLIADAARYALRISDAGIRAQAAGQPASGSPVERLWIALVFTGGCLAPLALLLPALRVAWIWIGSVAACVVGLVWLVVRGRVGAFPIASDLGIDFEMLLWQGAFSLFGLWLLCLAYDAVVSRNDVDEFLLGLWIGGTLLFAGLVNWTCNGRSILPLAPAAAMLLLRRIAQGGFSPRDRGLLLSAIGLGLVLSLALARADQQYAEAARSTVERLVAKYRGDGATVYFQGHWGWQYYAELAGARPVDLHRTTIEPPDVVLMPGDNTGVWPLRGEPWLAREQGEMLAPHRLATVNQRAGAAFYSSVLGPLPWRVGALPACPYEVLSPRQTVRFEPQPAADPATSAP